MFCGNKVWRACVFSFFVSEAVDIPDDCPLTLPTNPSLYRQLVQYFKQYFGTERAAVDEEADEETIIEG